MAHLDDLYSTLAKLKDLNLKDSLDLKDSIALLEKEIRRIENQERDIEILLQKVKDTVHPLMASNQLGIKLLIDFDPENGTDVRMVNPRKGIIPKKENQEELAQTLRKVRTSSGYSIPSHSKGPKTILRVKFPDGILIQEDKAADTMVKVIEKIGVERVERLNMKIYGHKLVGPFVNSKYKQTPTLNNLWVMTHSNTEKKLKQLDEISNRLNLGIKVDIVR